MDTYNRKYLVVIASLMMAVAFGGFSVATGIPMLIGFRLLQGCAMAFGNACCLAMVSDILPKEKYNSGLGYYSLAQVSCSAIAPTVGLELVKRSGFRLTYTFAACIMLLAALLACFVKSDFKRTRKLKISLNSIIAKEALIPAAFTMLMIAGGACVHSFLFLYAMERSVTGNVGLYFTISAVTMLVTRPLVGKLSDKYGLVKVVIPAVFCTILSLLIVSWSKSLTGLLIAAFISAFGQGAFQPAIQALTMKAVFSSRRGAASSTNFLAQDFGAFFGPIVAGQIVQLAGYVTMWRLMVIPYIVGVLLIVVFRRKIEQIEEEFAAR